MRSEIYAVHTTKQVHITTNYVPHISQISHHIIEKLLIIFFMWSIITDRWIHNFLRRTTKRFFRNKERYFKAYGEQNNEFKIQSHGDFSEL